MARILMIEDDDIFAEVATEWLEAAGHMVSVFEHGDEALRAVMASDPDLLILDYNLPGKSGMSILHEVRDLPYTATMPIMMLTAKAGKLLPARAQHGGADDYLAKPIAPETLVQHVEALLTKGSMLRQPAPIVGCN